jgi:O-antigen chain-terminating methyltransferase
MKRLLTPIFHHLARALGVLDMQNRLSSIERSRFTTPDLYMRLEQAFRGDPALIAARQFQYVAHVRPCVSESTPLLDLGCGRGEWLSLLNSEGLPAFGIDGNPVAVSLCQSKGLKVEHAYITETLSSIPKGSLGAVTLFQVLEHLPFADVLSVLGQARELLTPDGVLIAEIPNSETLRVGAGTFWIDPTHDRPLFPPVLRFLAEEAGFSRIQSIYSSPLEESPNLDGVDSNIAEILLHLHQQINGAGDFAIVARS